MPDFKPIEHLTTPDIVKRKIRQASAHMFVREFMQNAIEAAATAEIPRVKWWEFTEEGVRKLSVWNTGRGMDAEELLRNMDLGASGVEKLQGAAENFGLGAKLTGLKANHEGLLWRSCKNGRVSQLLLSWQEGEPGVIAQTADDGTPCFVLDVSHHYAATRLAEFDRDLCERWGKRDCSLLEFDWTLVVLLGSQREQDTVTDPLGEGMNWDRNYWLTSRINRRFYDLRPWNVSAICNAVTATQSRHLEGLKHLPLESEESIAFAWGAIRYCLLTKPKSDSSEKAKGLSGHAALVFKNEIYEPLCDGTWTGSASRYGVIAAANRVAIHVLLRDDFAATPNEQRTTLEEELGYGDRRPVRLEDFEDVIEENLPKFLRDFISVEDGRKKRSSKELRKRIKELMVALGLRAPARAKSGPVEVAQEREGNGKKYPLFEKEEMVADDAAVLGEEIPPRPRTESTPAQSRFGGGKPALPAAPTRLDQIPEIKWDPEKSSTRDTIGQFDPKHATITLFEDFPVLNQVVDQIIASGVPKTYRPRIIERAKNIIGYAAARHVLLAQAMLKRGTWTERQRDAATSAEAITASIGCVEMHYREVESAMRRFRKR